MNRTNNKTFGRCTTEKPCSTEQHLIEDLRIATLRGNIDQEIAIMDQLNRLVK